MQGRTSSAPVFLRLMVRQIHSTHQTPIELHLLGKFQINRGTQTLHLPTRKLESLLAFLALHPEPHSRDELAALGWGEAPQTEARNSLRNALATLRRILSARVISADREQAQINPEFPLHVDAQDFDRASNSEMVPENLQAMIDLYRGDLLKDFFDEWISFERERYRARYLGALLGLTQIMRSRSEYGRAVEFALTVLAHERSNERAHQHLMFCYLGMGNRISALRQYDECKRALKEELSVEPSPETTALYEWIQQTGALVRSDAARITNLPIPLSSFIGREREMTEAKQLLSETHLLTLTGTGGSGKTRLALQIATDLIDAFKDGVWWVDLGTLTNEMLAPQAIAKTFGVSERPGEELTETLASVLRGKNLLLVLDDCDHLVTACARLAEQLLKECRALRILATSREVLNVSGESVLQIPPMSFPPDANAPALPMAYESVRLFTERARAIQRDFQLTDANVSAIAQICQRLEGIPLALELAAAGVRLLDVNEIAARLDNRFNLLTVGKRTALPRQQTLRASMDWSYQLLPNEEKLQFYCLGVFVGGFTLDAVEEIADGNDRARTLEILSHLVDKSLVIVLHHDGITRYRQLETIRDYARERLIESGEGERIFRRHADFFAALAEESAEKLRSSDQVAWLSRLEDEHGNLRAALSWARASHASETALRLVGALALFWQLHGYLKEGWQWSSAILEDNGWKIENGNALPPLNQPLSAPLARALRGAASLCRQQDDGTLARAFCEQSIAIYRQLDDRKGLLRALNGLGEAILQQGDMQTAEEYFRQTLALAQELQYEHGVGIALLNLGETAYRQQDYSTARSFAEESLAVWRPRNDRRGIANALELLGQSMVRTGELEGANACYEEALAIRRDLGLKIGMATTIHELANLARLEKDYDAMQQNLKKCLLLFHELGNKRQVINCLTGLVAAAMVKCDWERAAQLAGILSSRRENDNGNVANNIETIRAALGEAKFRTCWREAETMSLEDAIKFATT